MRLQLEAGDVCVVCQGTNGPWRRGPLGLRCLCNSCGHIPGSGQEAKSYEEAIERLDYLRQQRLNRIRRRQGPDSADLMQRLQKLSNRSLAMAVQYASSLDKGQLFRPVAPLALAARAPVFKPVDPYPSSSITTHLRSRSRTIPASMIPYSKPIAQPSTSRLVPRTALPGFSTPRANRDFASRPAPRATFSHPMPVFARTRESSAEASTNRTYHPSALPPLISHLSSSHGLPIRATSPTSYAFGSYRQTEDMLCDLKAWQL